MAENNWTPPSDAVESNTEWTPPSDAVLSEDVKKKNLTTPTGGKDATRGSLPVGVAAPTTSEEGTSKEVNYGFPGAKEVSPFDINQKDQQKNTVSGVEPVNESDLSSAILKATGNQAQTFDNADLIKQQEQIDKNVKSLEKAPIIKKEIAEEREKREMFTKTGITKAILDNPNLFDTDTDNIETNRANQARFDNWISKIKTSVPKGMASDIDIYANKLNQHKNEIKTYADRLNDNPNDTDAAYEMANINLDLGNKDIATSLYQQVLNASNFSDSRGYNGLGYVAWKNKDFAGAKEHYAKAIELNPDDSIALNALGTLYAKENPALSKQYFDQAITVNPNSETALYNRAQLHDKMGDKQKAKQDMEDYQLIKSLNTIPLSIGAPGTKEYENSKKLENIANGMDAWLAGGAKSQDPTERMVFRLLNPLGGMASTTFGGIEKGAEDVSEGTKMISSGMARTLYQSDAITGKASGPSANEELLHGLVKTAAGIAHGYFGIEMGTTGGGAMFDIAASYAPEKLNAIMMAPVSTVMDQFVKNPSDFTKETFGLLDLVGAMVMMHGATKGATDLVDIGKSMLKHEKIKPEDAKAVNEIIANNEISIDDANKAKAVVGDLPEGTTIENQGNVIADAISTATPEQIEAASTKVEEEAKAKTALEITTPLEENVGQMVNYEGVEGILKTDKEGNLFVHTDDGGEVLIEGGLSGKPASELGVRFATPKPEVEVKEEHTEPIPDNQITYDYDNNTVNIYGKDYTYEGVETDAKGNTTALRVTDANGKVKFIRNENAIVEFEIQKELAENRQLDNVTAEEITKIADENEITSETKPVEPSETTAEQIQQERPTEVAPTLKVEEIKVEPTEKKDKKASMLDELHAEMGTEPEAKLEAKLEGGAKPAAETPKAESELPELSRQDVVEQMRPITDQMAKVEMEFSNRGYEIDWDYDNEIQITDKKTGEAVDVEDLPNDLLTQAGKYEDATSRLADYDQGAYQESLDNSRKALQGEEAPYEEVKPQGLPEAKVEGGAKAETATPKTEEIKAVNAETPGIVDKTPEEIAQEESKLTDKLLAGEAEKRRKDGEHTKDGIVYKRNEKSEGVKGKTGEVRFTNQISVPFTFRLVEADELQPSHINGVRNPNHFIPEAQPKSRTDQASIQAEDSFAENPRFSELGENTNAYSGAPIINERGEVIQGNNRSAGLKKGYRRGNNKYKADLANNAEQFGLTREQVEGMKNPVLVREIKVTDDGAVELGNYDVKDLETGGKRRLDPVTIVRRMPLNAKAKIAEMLFGEEGKTLNQAIRDNQGALMDALAPYLNQAQRNTILKEGVLTETGAKDLEGLIQHFMFDNGDPALSELFENMSHNQKEGLRKSLPFVLGTEYEKSVLPEIQNAILALNEFTSSGKTDFNTWKKQVDMFSGKTPEELYTPTEMAIAEKLVDAKTQKDITKVFAKYSELVNGSKGDMFTEPTEGVSKKEAVKQTFKVEYDEKPKEIEQGITGSKEAPAGEKVSEVQPGAEQAAKPTVEEGLKAIDDAKDATKKFLKDNKIISYGKTKKAGFVDPEKVIDKAFDLAKGVYKVSFNVNEAIKKAVEHIKSSTWYKSLTSEEKALAEQTVTKQIQSLSEATKRELAPEQESKLKAFVEKKLKAGESIEDVKDVLVDYGVAKDKIAELVGEKPAAETPQAGSVGVEGDFKIDNKDTFYHASPTKRNGRLKPSTAQQFGTGVYFTTSKDLALNSIGEHITEAKLALDNPVYTNTKEWGGVEELALKKANEGKEKDEDGYIIDEEYDISEIKAKFISDAAKELGYDAIIDKNSPQYENEVVVLDETKIKYPEDLQQSLKETPQAEEITPQKETIGKFSELTNFDQQLEDASTTAKKKQIEANRDKWLNENPSMKDIYSNAKEIIKQLEKEGLVTEKKGPCM